MLRCNINLRALTEAELVCGSCTICKARSKLNYPFARDLLTSEAFIEALKLLIQAGTPYKCEPPEVVKNPDIRVRNDKDDSRLICRIEAKLLEGFAFMKAQQLLSDHLLPKETLVVDKPKLLSYFACKKSDFVKEGRTVPLFVVWKLDRPCKDVGGITVFQEIDQLELIFNARRNNREFERETVGSDIVAGQKRGITTKYHFSLTECRPIEELIPAIMRLK